MIINDLKIELISWISNQADESSIQRLKETVDDIDFEQESKSMIIGFRPNNAPVIKSDFLKCIQQAEHQIESGEFLSLENFEIEVDSW